MGHPHSSLSICAVFGPICMLLIMMTGILIMIVIVIVFLLMSDSDEDNAHCYHLFFCVYGNNNK